MKVFSYSTEKSEAQIGVEYEEEFYNFSLAWEFYKQIKNSGRGPDLNFLQIMVEADFLHPDTFAEVFSVLKQYRPLHDLKVKKPFRFLPPVGRPQKILCIGRNFKKHAEELGNKIPKEPIFFSKSPSALIGHETAIRLPRDVGRVDHEGELAIVMGKQAQNIAASRTFDFIAGFTILNDVTARDMQHADRSEGKPWFRSKNFDTFCPCGPFLTPTNSIQDYRKLTLEVKVNGAKKQESSLENMIFDLTEIVSYLSKFCTLLPGDIIATGTPGGVSEIHAGDTVACTIDQLGTLKNGVE